MLSNIGISCEKRGWVMKKAIASVALVLLTSAAYAQTTGAATIVGTVTDTTGAVIPGAKVVVVNTETGFKFDGLTNSDGYYYVPYLRPSSLNQPRWLVSYSRSESIPHDTSGFHANPSSVCVPHTTRTI